MSTTASTPPTWLGIKTKLQAGVAVGDTVGVRVRVSIEGDFEANVRIDIEVAAGAGRRGG